MGKWYNNSIEMDVWYGYGFDTREEAIEDGVQQYIDRLNGNPTDLFDDYVDELPTVFCIGEGKPFIPTIDIDDIIERLQEYASYECGEVADDFLKWRDIRDYVDDLKENLQRELDAWLERHNLTPSFCSIINIEQVDVKDYITEKTAVPTIGDCIESR